MNKGKVLALYMTIPDLMKAGHRMKCEDFECDPDGIIGDMKYETTQERVMVLTCQKSYDIAAEAGIVVEQGVLLENIHVDIDLYGLKVGSVIEAGEAMLEITGICGSYGYLMALSPELPELLEGKRGFFVRPLDEALICVGDEVGVAKEV
jgi:MOSC domain-containing protein YiiM